MPQCRREKKMTDGSVETCVLEHRHGGRHSFASDGKTVKEVRITATFAPGADMQAIRDWLKAVPAGAVQKIKTSPR